MKSYRITLSMRSASSSLWRAETVWGYLCWLLLWRRGEDELQTWLDLYEQGTPPLILSDGFPGDLVPRPMFLPVLQAVNNRQDQLEQLRQRKQLKQLSWISLEQFERIRQGEAFDLLEGGKLPEVPGSRVNFRNSISRLTGTTGEEGQLYPFVEHPWKDVTLYAKIADGALDTVRALLADLQLTGFGRRKSVGAGEITSWALEEFDGFDRVSDANAFVTLSHFVPAQSDPTRGKWRVSMKYGKVGEDWPENRHPFKHPVLTLSAGSWFYSTHPDRSWFGRMVKGVSPVSAKIVQYGLAFALPMRIPDTS